MAAPPTALSYTYLTASQIEARLRALATSAPQLCQVLQLAPTHEGRRAVVLRVRHPSAPSNAIPILFTAGLHAREWAPPDILVDLRDAPRHRRRLCARFPRRQRVLSAIRQVAAHQRPSPSFRPSQEHEPAHRSVQGSAGAARCRAADPFEARNLHCAPHQCGWTGLFAVSTARCQPAGLDVAKESRTDGGGACASVLGLDSGVGTDINRNFDFAWDASQYYHPDALAPGNTSFSTDPCVYSARDGFTSAKPQEHPELATSRERVRVPAAGLSGERLAGSRRCLTELRSRPFTGRRRRSSTGSRADAPCRTRRSRIGPRERSAGPRGRLLPSRCDRAAGIIQKHWHPVARFRGLLPGRKRAAAGRRTTPRDLDSDDPGRAGAVQGSGEGCGIRGQGLQEPMNVSRSSCSFIPLAVSAGHAK